MRFSQILEKFAVSLFTREWIEMAEMPNVFISCVASPSLRGSGLKFKNSRTSQPHQVSLPLYEGVD